MFSFFLLIVMHGLHYYKGGWFWRTSYTNRKIPPETPLTSLADFHGVSCDSCKGCTRTSPPYGSPTDGPEPAPLVAENIVPKSVVERLVVESVQMFSTNIFR